MNKDRTISWGELSVRPGEYATGLVKVAELSHGGAIHIPVMIANGLEPGPRLWLNGAIHGDEINGPMAIRSIMPKLDPTKLIGAVIATPISNPLAFQARQKNTPQDGLDMDMQFPGDSNGTLSQRLAHVLFTEIQRVATHLVDFHTLGTPFDALPYTVFKRLPGVSAELCDGAEKMARAFGGTAHCRVDFSGNLSEVPGNVTGFLDVQCLEHGIPAFMAELGSGGHIQQEMVAFGEKGIMNILHELDMWQESTKTEAETSKEQPPIITRRRFIYADHGGLVVDSAPPGSILEQGELICRVIDMFGTVQEIVADQKMYIIAARKNPPVDTGDRVAFVGTEW